MREFEVSKIIIDEKAHEQIVVLKEKNGQQLLPIVIGINEASAIKIQFGNITPPRPMTHDLIKLLLDSFGATLERIIIDKLVDSTFHAKLVLKTGSSRTKKIDSRPSDSIALAVRVGAPIFIEDEVLKQSSFQGK